MRQQLLIPLGLLIGLLSCTPKGDESVTVVKTGSNIEYHVQLDKIKDSVQLRLSDVATDFEFVTLETNEECYLQHGGYYVTNEYILVLKSRHGILQFDRKGKFIRTLALKGKGPTEFLASEWTFDVKNEVLYLMDLVKKNYFLAFDLESGKYIKDIPKAFAGSSADIKFVGDQQLLVAPSGYLREYSEPYYLYWQTLEGKFVKGIPAPKDVYVKSRALKLYQREEVWRYQNYRDDTIYQIEDEVMQPFVVFHLGNPNPPRNTVGHSYQSLQFEVKDWLVFAHWVITRVEKRGNGMSIGSGVTLHVLNKKNRDAKIIASFLVEPTHHTQDHYTYQRFIFQDDGIIHFPYQAVDLLEQAEIALADPEFKDPYRSTLKKVVEGLDEEDNPVLLIAKMK